MTSQEVPLCGADVGEYKPSQYLRLQAAYYSRKRFNSSYYRKKLIHPITERNAIKTHQYLIESDDKDNNKNIESDDKDNNKNKDTILFQGYNEGELHDLRKEIIAMNCRCKKISCYACEKQKKITMDDRLDDEYVYNHKKNKNKHYQSCHDDDDDDDDAPLWLQTFNKYTTTGKKRKLSTKIIPTTCKKRKIYNRRKLSADL